jgi:excisionase family DNA binding protein
MKKNYFTIKEAAKILGVTPQTLRNWDKSGKLKALRNPINNYRIYRTMDIELFLRKIESKGKVHLG